MLAGFTVDLAFALHALCVEVKARIDAAAHLPQTAKRCSRLVDQIDGMIDGCNQEDRRTRVILENINACMNDLGGVVQVELGSRLTHGFERRLVSNKLKNVIKNGFKYAFQIQLAPLRLGELVSKLEGSVDGQQGGGASGICICLSLMRKGKDVLDAEQDLETVESELRKHVESLVQATQLHSFSTRKSNKLKQADARRFWDEHFGDQREVSLGASAEALRFECQEKQVVIDFDAVLPICRACFSGAETVSVLNFGDVFSLASVSEAGSYGSTPLKKPTKTHGYKPARASTVNSPPSFQASQTTNYLTVCSCLYITTTCNYAIHT